jgi:hypothetical protein
MRRIVVLASFAAALALAGCDQEQPQVQNAQPVAQLPPPPAPVTQPVQQQNMTASRSRRRRSEYKSESDSFYGEDKQFYSGSEEDSYDDEDGSDRRADRHDDHKRAVAHLWTDGFGRQHISSDDEQAFYAEQASHDTINAKTTRDPWFGYDKHCKK